MLGRYLAGIVLLSACATVPQMTASRYMLGTDALRRSDAHDLLGAIEELRPTWLESCTMVFKNGREYGGVETLQEFVAADVQSVQLIPKGHPRPGAGSVGMSDCSAIQVTKAEAEE